MVDNTIAVTAGSGTNVRTVTNTGVDGGAHQQVMSIADSAGNLLGTAAAPIPVAVADGYATVSIAANATSSGQLAIANNGGTGVIQLTGTWVATVQVQVNADGSSWTNITGSNSVTNALTGGYVAGGNITAAGIYQVDIAGFGGIRVITTAYTSGTVTGVVRTTASESVVGIEGTPTVLLGSGTLANPIGRVQLFDGANAPAVKAASTAVAAADPSLVVGLSPNSPLPAGTAVLGSVFPGATSVATSTTTQAASATLTLQTVDQGGTVFRSKLHVLVAHTAALTPAQLEIQESADASTYRVTRRVPIPSDGLVHEFEFPMPSRAYKVNFVNGATAQTAFFLQAALYGTDGYSAALERQNLQFPLSATALTGAGTFNSPALDLGPTHNWDRVRVSARADQTGTLYIQQSRDGTNFYTMRGSDAGLGATMNGTGLTVSASVGSAEFLEQKIVERYVRAVYANGATAQGVFDLNCALLAA